MYIVQHWQWSWEVDPTHLSIRARAEKYWSQTCRICRQVRHTRAVHVQVMRKHWMHILKHLSLNVQKNEGGEISLAPRCRQSAIARRRQARTEQHQARQGSAHSVRLSGPAIFPTTLLLHSSCTLSLCNTCWIWTSFLALKSGDKGVLEVPTFKIQWVPYLIPFILP